MKASEIEVGQELVESRNRDILKYQYGNTKVVVVETGIKVKSRNYTYVPGTKVRDENGHEYPVPNTRLRGLWSEYAEQKARMDAYAAEKRGKEQRAQFERAEAAWRLEMAFRSAGMEPHPNGLHVFGDSAVTLKAVGWDMNKHGRAVTVFPNLIAHVEKGADLMVKAATVAGVLPVGSDV